MKYACIARHRGEHSLRLMCRVLDVSQLARVSERSAEYSFGAGRAFDVVFFFAGAAPNADPAPRKRVTDQTPIEKVDFLVNFGIWMIADNS